MTEQTNAGHRGAEPVPLFDLMVGGIQASGYPQGQGFVVRAGSAARAQHAPSFVRHNYFKLRSSLLSEGRLRQTGDPDRLTYTQDVLFDSPSAAAAVTLGGAYNGPRVWKRVGTGQSYGDWQAGHTPGPVREAAPAEADFGWVPFFQALGHRLLDFQAPDRQLALLRLLREVGIAINHDEFEELTVIDTFNFV